LSAVYAEKGEGAMATTTDVTEREARGTYPLGVSRPPLEITDLPAPEEVFNVPKVGRKELIKFVLGPSLIALGISIGSGEWLLGPLNIGTLGFIGTGWIITLSAVLQVFYNIEIARYVVATGEVPIVGFARTPPGFLFWLPFSILALYFAQIWGGWAKAAASGLFALINGNVPGDADSGTVELLALGLLVVVFLIAILSRKVTRGLEITNLSFVAIQLLFLLVIDLILVPPSVWWEGIRGFLTPALPPEGSDATLIGGLVGFTALASGLNWYAMNHYRDKGYGMGHRVGFIGGLRSGKQEVLPVGMTFPDDAKNAVMWKRWMRYLKIDMWVIFFGGAMLGMLLPTILMSQMVKLTGNTPTEANVPTFIADALGQQYGRPLFYIALLVGFLILFDTQLSIFEALVRNMTDTLNLSGRFRKMVSGDPRRFYYPFMIVLVGVIWVFLHFFQDATTLVAISANMSNFGALMFPFVMIYLNRRLPKAARPGPWSYVALIANFLFFGFFFVNFVADQFFGGPLIEF
jgi:hypothetical protein